MKKLLAAVVVLLMTVAPGHAKTMTIGVSRAWLLSGRRLRLWLGGPGGRRRARGHASARHRHGQLCALCLWRGFPRRTRVAGDGRRRPACLGIRLSCARKTQPDGRASRSVGSETRADSRLVQTLAGNAGNGRPGRPTAGRSARNAGALPSAGRAEADSGVLVTKTCQTLNRLETLVSEAARERRSHLAADAPDPEPLLRTLLRLRHELVMLLRAVWEPGGGEMVRKQLAGPWAFAVEAGAAALKDVGQAFSGRRTPAGSGALAESVVVYTASIDEMRRRDLTRALPSDTVDRISGTGFALDQFRRDLNDLIERARERSAQAGECAKG